MVATVAVTVVAIVWAPLRPSVRPAINTLVFVSIKATAPAALNAVANFTYKDSSGRTACALSRVALLRVG